MESMKLIPGTLIFQCPQASPKEQAISEVVPGWSGYPITHVSILMDQNRVIEAVPSGVRTETWEDFLRRLIKEGHKTVVLARPLPRVLPSLEDALRWLKTQEFKPYNHTFLESGAGWYCSPLVEAFYRKAGAPPGFLPESTLNYFAPGTDTIHPFWREYYGRHGLEVPQGQPGSHPATQSCSENLRKEILPLN